MGFTSLAYHMDVEWMHEAYRRTRKDKAVGVDGQTAAEFEADLEGNLQSLLDRAKSGTYRAPPVRRAHIPKGGSGSERRPIGVPTLADKVLQRAVLMLLEPIYEQDFYDCSYGFRPGRSAHQALESLWRQTMAVKGGWIVEIDIQKCFDTLDHAHLREFLKRRVRDGVLHRLIGKWLNAGVMEDGSVSYPDSGSPQGGVISPLLSNIYLHYVLDEWLDQQVKPCMYGQVYLARFADDAVIGFTDERDARRVMDVLPKRFEKYGLSLHPSKTRMVPFQRPSLQSKGKGGSSSGSLGPGRFEWLGFTHYWGGSRKGNWVVKRKTASSRLSRALQRVNEWCRRNRHRPLIEQQNALSQKLLGHFSYYGITGNATALSSFRTAVDRLWRKWLSRRNRRGPIGWDRFRRLLERYALPEVRVVHSVCSVSQRNHDPRNRMH